MEVLLRLTGLFTSCDCPTVPGTETFSLEAFTMKGFSLVFLPIFALICLAANAASEQTDAEHPAPTSTANGAIGDYVAAGLGISTRELTSALDAKTSDDLPDTISSSSRFLTFYNQSATLTSAGASYSVSATAENITTISATDCWHSWRDYWSASSVNKLTSEVTFDVTSTRTETVTRFSETSWITSSWFSTIYTWTEFQGSTLYSENYPVSVSSSYETHIDSDVRWLVNTEWSTLGEYYETRVVTDGSYRSILVGSTTALPTPRCELPAILAECSMEWSAKIHDRPSSPAPDCTQAMITGDWCTSLRSQYLKPSKFMRKDQDVGWVTTNNTSYFPVSKSLAPGCTLGCQACSITGESVQLYYWPPATATLVENGTETATLTPFARNGSSIRTVAIDGE
jgi:hypothetical protein